jgi:hypothetical protein
MPDNDQESVFKESLAGAIQAVDELQRQTQNSENLAPSLMLFGGALRFLRLALNLWHPLPEPDSSGDLTGIITLLQHCNRKCSDTLHIVQQSPEAWMESCLQNTVILQQDTYSIVCSLINLKK